MTICFNISTLPQTWHNGSNINNLGAKEQ